MLFKHFGFTVENVVGRRFVTRRCTTLDADAFGFDMPTGSSEHDHQSRHQRLRPHRPQHPARASTKAARSTTSQIVAINDLGSAETNAHLTRYDTAHGKFPGKVAVDGDAMVVNGDRIKVFAQRNPAEAAVEGRSASTSCSNARACSRPRKRPSAHLKGGAKKVIISAPGGKDVDATIVYGVNHQVLKATRHGHLERVLHDQLPGAAGQAAARQDRRASAA